MTAEVLGEPGCPNAIYPNHRASRVRLRLHAQPSLPPDCFLPRPSPAIRHLFAVHRTNVSSPAWRSPVTRRLQVIVIIRECIQNTQGLVKEPTSTHETPNEIYPDTPCNTTYTGYLCLEATKIVMKLGRTPSITKNYLSESPCIEHCSRSECLLSCGALLPPDFS
ncbi:hypothetical protein OG21DRAFT_1516959 [Imleria badia]|nr:hypothetical protein OG21DRAFT_1516959 [Imleria badia]